jgi:hypothetical protein
VSLPPSSCDWSSVRTSWGVLTSFLEIKDRYEFLPVIASVDGSWPITGLQYKCAGMRKHTQAWHGLRVSGKCDTALLHSEGVVVLSDAMVSPRICDAAEVKPFGLRYALDKKPIFPFSFDMVARARLDVSVHVQPAVQHRSIRRRPVRPAVSSQNRGVRIRS